jgi:hypothetical protein
VSDNVVIRYPSPPPQTRWSIVIEQFLLAFMAFVAGLSWATYYTARVGLKRAEQEYAAARSAKAEGDAYRDRAQALLEDLQQQAPIKPHSDKLEPSNADQMSRL